eukprot:112475-Pyramimonas_sp.AAC.1
MNTECEEKTLLGFPTGEKPGFSPLVGHCIYVLRDALCFTLRIQGCGPMASCSEHPMYSTLSQSVLSHSIIYAIWAHLGETSLGAGAAYPPSPTA